MTDHDVGLQALDRVFKLMLIDDEWSVRGDRTFAWWGGPSPQGVFVSSPVLSFDCWVSRLTAVTHLVSGVRQSDAALGVLNGFNASGRSTSALVLHQEDTVSLFTTATVHEQVLDSSPRFFTFAAATQAADAEAMGDELARLLGGQRVMSAHPTSGPRQHLDDILGVYEHIVLPVAQEPSRYTEQEMMDVESRLEQAGLFVKRQGMQVRAFYPYPGSSSMLDVDGAARQDALGSGLRITLKIPEWPQPDEALVAANALNFHEISSGALLNLSGAWHVADDGSLTFGGFYPNAIFKLGMAAHLASAMAMRAEWIGSLRDQRSRKERFEAMYEWLRQRLGAEGES